VRYDAIVIGAGMSGLAAALRLALYDRRVVVLERHTLWGGLNSFYTLEGRRFDVGLHAVTNWAPPRAPGAPLTRLLRQLRLRHEELHLGEQGHSEIAFRDARLSFTNDFACLEAQVERTFPSQRDGFALLVRAIREHRLDEDAASAESGRAFLGRFLSDPRLIEMLCLPLCYYGSAREDDVDRDQLVVLFRSIFLEGLCRPEGGVRTLLNLLVKRLKRSGAELRLGTGVREVVLDAGRARGVVLDDGSELEAGLILSSAGLVESLRLCGREVESRHVGPADQGRLSFLESISVLDAPPAALGLDAATVFYCLEDRLRYRRPDGLTSTASGVISAPNNFRSERPLEEGLVRLTVLANHDRWCELPEPDYAAAKERAADAAIAAASELVPDWRARTVFRDVFTPRTIRRFTGHLGGAVYGSPSKRPTGESGVPGLVLCGTDQGYLGIVGALTSGVMMANRHVLAPAMVRA